VKRVLIVDDEAMNRDVIAMVLRKEGLEVAEAPDGAAALTLLEEERFGMVLMDLMMPVMDGYAAIAAIRAEPRHRTLPVVVVTALNDQGSVARAMELGADACIIKPFDLPLLVRTVRDGLERGRSGSKERG
jgi:sigma-B regulation protein RsbU (phosphoserine phosphatase)